MSVPMYKRKESSAEFLNTYKSIAKETYAIVMRDLGVKKKTYSIKFLFQVYNVEEIDKETINRIAEKYGMTEVESEKYGIWIIEHWKDSLMEATRRLGIELELANNIYITIDDEYIERRRHWNNAIGWCHVLKNTLREIIECLNVKVGAYEILIGRLWKEISLLKGLRKSDKREREKALAILAEKETTKANDVSNVIEGVSTVNG